MKRAAIASDTVEILKRGSYESPDGKTVVIGKDQEACEAGTRLYLPEELDDLLSGLRALTCETDIELLNETTIAGIRRVFPTSERVGVLNFASAKNPGGGFLNGAHAQEESLARASGLYHSLLKARPYYESHRKMESCFYSDRMIHSPGCPVFRDDGGTLFEEPCLVDFVTSPAPNAGVIRRKEPDRVGEIEESLRGRAAKVLALFQTSGCSHLILGAWGCGVFQNDPAVVAKVFRDLLKGPFDQRFKKITLSVFDGSKEQRTFGQFRAAFDPELG